MRNKYENRIRRTLTRKDTTHELRRALAISIYDRLPKESIFGEMCVAQADIQKEMNCSPSTACRSLDGMKRAGWFKVIKAGKEVYLQYIGEPVEPEKEVTKSSAITTVATVLADIANIQDTLSAMTDFYETLDVEYEQVQQLNAMVRDTVLELANQADALAFTISEE
tara:strand:+ start:612 stop:1112 length:501 start_codon:yes stop_codon:yes gene_type:complete